MNIVKITFIGALLVLTACNKTENTTAPEQDVTATTADTTAAPTVTDDKTAITEMVKNMYQWVEKDREIMDEIKIVEKDSTITGFNATDTAKFLKRLKESGFFTNEFIRNMNAITTTQNEMLSSGKAKWMVGELPPFGNDASPWCNCQDEPSNNAYSKIAITFGKMDATKAELSWNWSATNSNDNYKIRAVKENGTWKVAWMQGWDYKANTTVNY